jgi:hypothetical protein
LHPTSPERFEIVGHSVPSSDVLSDPPWHKHKPDNTGIFPCIADDKHLSAMDDMLLFKTFVNLYIV